MNRLPLVVPLLTIARCRCLSVPEGNSIYSQGIWFRPIRVVDLDIRDDRRRLDWLGIRERSVELSPAVVQLNWGTTLASKVSAFGMVP